MNEFNVLGSLGAAAVFGILTGSWMVFLVAGALMIAAGVCNGDIRTGRGRRQ